MKNMIEDLSEKIEPGHPSGLCALCDCAIEKYDDSTIVIAHGSKYLVHKICIDNEGE